MRVRNLFRVLVDRVGVVLVCTLAALALSFIALRHSPRIYSSVAVIQVHEPGAEGGRALDSPAAEFKRTARTIEEMVEGRGVLGRVMESMDLAADPRFTAPGDGDAPSESEVLAMLNEAVDAKMRPQTRLLDIVVDHRDPRLAKEIADAVVEAFMTTYANQRSAADTASRQALEEEVERLGRQFQEARKALLVYQERASSGAFERQTATVQRLEKELGAKRALRLSLETQYEAFQKNEKDPIALQSIPFIAQDPTIAELRARIAAQEGKFAQIKERYKHRHVKYIEAETLLQKLQKSLEEAMFAAGETLWHAYQETLTAEKRLEEELKSEGEKALARSRATAEEEALLTEVRAKEQLYKDALERLQARDRAVPGSVTLVQEAAVPEVPSKPQKEKVLVLGSALGFFVGLGLVMVLGLLDTSLHSFDEAEEFLGLPVLSTIPEVDGGRIGGSRLVMGRTGVLSGAESFRSLRTFLSVSGREASPRTYLFTSSLPEEGKTFCALNFAYSLAQQGFRVVLVDGDLRRPEVEACLAGTQGKRVGVTDFLNGDTTLDEVVCETGIANFSFIPAGTPVANPLDLLTPERLGELMEACLRRFDRIVLDSAPVFGVSDTMLLTRHSDLVALVVRARQTPRKTVLHAAENLRKADAPLAGIVLNGVAPSAWRNANDPFFDYGYARERLEEGTGVGSPDVAERS